MKTELRIPDPAKAKAFFEDKITFTTGPIEVRHMLQEHQDVNIIDVREHDDYQKGHVPGALNLPKDKWHTLEGLSKDRTNICYCYSAVCHLAAKAAYTFAERGYPVMEMDGGFDEWQEHGLDVETVTHRISVGVA